MLQRGNNCGEACAFFVRDKRTGNQGARAHAAVFKDGDRGAYLQCVADTYEAPFHLLRQIFVEGVHIFAFGEDLGSIFEFHLQ